MEGMNDLNDMSQWDHPVFPVAVAAQASMVAPGTLRMWFVRERITLKAGEFDPGTDAEKAGLPRLLTFRTVLTIAAAAALVRTGTDVAVAYEAAKEWTWFGEGWNGQGPCPRDPACLFELPSFTFLIHRGGPFAKVVKGNPAPDYPDLFAGGNPVPPSPTIVHLNYIDKYVRGVCEGFLRDA